MKKTSSENMERMKAVGERVFAVLKDVAMTLFVFYKENLIKIFEALKAFWDKNGDTIMSIVATVFEIILTIIEKV